MDDQALRVQGMLEKTECVLDICSKQRADLATAQERYDQQQTAYAECKRQLAAEQKRCRMLLQRVLALERSKHELTAQLKKKATSLVTVAVQTSADAYCPQNVPNYKSLQAYHGGLPETEPDKQRIMQHEAPVLPTDLYPASSVQSREVEPQQLATPSNSLAARIGAPGQPRTRTSMVETSVSQAPTVADSFVPSQSQGTQSCCAPSMPLEMQGVSGSQASAYVVASIPQITPLSQVPLSQVPQSQVPLPQTAQFQVPLPQHAHSQIPLSQVPQPQTAQSRIPLSQVPLGSAQSFQVSSRSPAFYPIPNPSQFCGASTLSAQASSTRCSTHSGSHDVPPLPADVPSSCACGHSIGTVPPSPAAASQCPHCPYLCHPTGQPCSLPQGTTASVMPGPHCFSECQSRHEVDSNLVSCPKRDSWSNLEHYHAAGTSDPVRRGPTTLLERRECDDDGPDDDDDDEETVPNDRHTLWTHRTTASWTLPKASLPRIPLSKQQHNDAVPTRKFGRLSSLGDRSNSPAAVTPLSISPWTPKPPPSPSGAQPTSLAAALLKYSSSRSVGLPWKDNAPVTARRGSGALPPLPPRRAASAECATQPLPLVSSDRRVTESAELLRELTKRIENKKPQYLGWLSRVSPVSERGCL